MKYAYTATRKNGALENGTIEARNPAEAAAEIRRTGLLLVSLKRARGTGWNPFGRFGFVSNLQRVTFSKHLSLMIRAGLPIDESVRILRDQAEGAFRRVLGDVLQAVEGGRALSDGFAEHPEVFSELFISTIRAGEVSGTLEASLDDLAIQLSKSFELKRKIRSAMIYPVIVLVAAGGIGMGLSLFVLPQVIKLFETITVELPWATRVLIGFSKYMAQNGVWTILGLSAFIYAFWQFIHLKPIRPFTDAALLRIPIFGKLAHLYNQAVFARTMGTLLRSGIDITQAFQIASKTIANASYKRALLKVKAGTEAGIPASTSLEEFPRLFPKITTRMLSVGEQTGKLEETFIYLSDFYEDELDAMTKNLSTILEPVLLLVIGISVAYIALAIIMPVYNFIGNIERL